MDIIVHLILSSGVLRDERMPQQHRRRPPCARFSLEATRDEVSELPGSGGRSLRWLRHADGAHQAGPIAPPPDVEGESAEIKLEDADAEAPNVAGVAVVLAVVEIGVDPLGAHVGDGPDGGVARVHGLFQDPADSEISDLDLLPRVDEEIRRLDVTVDDAAAMEVG